MKKIDAVRTDEGKTITMIEVAEALRDCKYVFYGTFSPSLLYNHKNTIIEALKLLRDELLKGDNDGADKTN